MTPSHVLVPLDGSPLAEEALRYAIETFDCRITVLNVVTPVDAEMSEGGILDIEDPRLEDARGNAERLIERAVRLAESASGPIETAIEVGEPAEAILGFVDANDVDHVVMGGHGDRGGIAERLLGSVATTVVTESPVPVTVLK